MHKTFSRIFLFVATLVASLSVLPAWAGDQTREVTAFTSISSQGAYKMTVNVGQKQSVVISGSDAALARIDTKVTDGVLIVSTVERSRSSNSHDADDVRVTINVEQLNQFQMEGAGKTDIYNINAEKFRLNYQGVGLLKATGKVQTFVLKAEGVGSVNARELVAQHVDVTLQGVGSAQVRATDSLRAKLEGIGSLTYYGKPSRISKTVDGIGRIASGE